MRSSSPLWTSAACIISHWQGLKGQSGEGDGRPRVDALVAISGNRMIGTVIGTNDGRKGWVNRLAVDPEHRGRAWPGLWKGVEECFKARSLNIFSCLINAENGPSRSLFENDRLRPTPGGRILFQEDRTGHLSRLCIIKFWKSSGTVYLRQRRIRPIDDRTP